LSPTVRRAAYDTIRSSVAASDPTAIGAALLALEDADEDLRRVALMSLPRQLDAEVARRLRVVIARETFDAWDYSDKRRAFLAYASAAGKRAAKELVEVLATRAMFSSDDLDDRRCSAAFALASLGDDNFMGTLEAEAKRMFGSKRIKEACEAAMSMLKFKRPLEQESAAIVLVAKDETEVIPTAHLPKPIWEDLANAATAVNQRAVSASPPRRSP
jgi:hypothetical protein